MSESTNQLNDSELQALNFLRDLKLLGRVGTGTRDTFTAISGLYKNAALSDGMFANRNSACFADTRACVKTTVFGLQNILEETQRKGTVDLTPLQAGNHEEARKMIQDAVGLLRGALARDFSLEYATSVQQEAARQSARR